MDELDQLRFLAYKRWVWLNDSKNYGNDYYNRVRDEYFQMINSIWSIENAREERKNKIVAACISGGIGFGGICLTAGISNSSWGAAFERGTKGIVGKIIGNSFR